MTIGRVRAVAAVGIAIAASIYLLRLDEAAGMIVDDAFYIVLAKAIAGGDGYRLISSAATPIMPAGVPPGFPALLAPVFLVSPAYPANLLSLKLISILAMAGVGVLCWRDLTGYRGVAPEQATWLALAVVITPAFLFLATSTVMAECAFTLAQLGVVVAVERIDRARRPLANAIVAGLVAAAAVYMRTAGVAVIAAAVVYLASRRRWRPLLAFAATVIACALPWQLYARANAAPFEERYAHGGTIAYSYAEMLAMTEPGQVHHQADAGQITARAIRNVAGVVTRDVGAVIVPQLYRGPHESGEEVVSIGAPGRGSMGGAAGTQIVSAILFAVLVLGVARTRSWFSMPALLMAASMAMIAAVPADTFRYVVPLAPFLLLYVWRGVAQPRVARIVVVSILGLHLLDHAAYLNERANGRSTWLADARDIDQVVDWLNRQGQPGPVAATNPGLIYLRTGRQAVASAFPHLNWEAWRAAGIRYVVGTNAAEVPRQGTVRLKTEKGLWIVEM
jgi:hypothetical protein